MQLRRQVVAAREAPPVATRIDDSMPSRSRTSQRRVLAAEPLCTTPRLGDAEEHCSPSSASLLTRRNALRVFTGLTASVAIGGYSRPGVASMPTVPAAEIDIHCHVFNIRDQA